MNVGEQSRGGGPSDKTSLSTGLEGEDILESLDDIFRRSCRSRPWGRVCLVVGKQSQSLETYLRVVQKNFRKCLIMAVHSESRRERAGVED